jgi:hypothetical protein
MKNPFPGMNPYLERHWNDVHTRLCAYISAAIQPTLPAGLRARAEEDVVLETTGRASLQEYRADTVVVERREVAPNARPGPSVATVEPLVIRHMRKTIRRRWVKIIDVTDGDRVVTVIEILSPGNNAAGSLNKKYRRKLGRQRRGDRLTPLVAKAHGDQERRTAAGLAGALSRVRPPRGRRRR